MMPTHCVCRRSEHRIRSGYVAVAMGALMWCSGSMAIAQTFNWNAPASGSWFAPGNWTPNAIPSTTASTARIGGTAPLTVVVDTSNALVGTLDLANPNAILRVGSGRQLQVETGAAVNGTLEVGDGTASGFTSFRFGTFAGFTGSGQVVLLGPRTDTSRAQLVAGPGGASWPKTLTLRGTGRVVGNHFVVGTVRADDPLGGVLEFSNGLVNGLGAGEFVADGGTLRVFQARFFDATLRTINSGVLEFSAPVATTSALPQLANNCTIRGRTRFVRNMTVLVDTDIDSDAELLSGGSLAFQTYGAGTKVRAVVNVEGTAPGSGFGFAPGDSNGEGSITLNAAQDARHAVLFGNDSIVGPGWVVNGQGTIAGDFTLNCRIIADRSNGPAMTFEDAYVNGTGSIEARGGRLTFGDEAHITGLRILGDPGSQSVIEYPSFGGDTYWTNVTSDIGLFCRNGRLVLDGCTINGPVLIDSAGSLTGGRIELTGTGSSIFGTVTIRSGSLSATGVPLNGAGEVVLANSTINGNASISILGGGIGDGWTIRGTGQAYMSGTVGARTVADDPAGKALKLAGTWTGAGTTPISVSTGELVIEKPAVMTGFAVTGDPGSKPVRVGLDDFYPYGSDAIELRSLQFHVPISIGQYRCRIRDASMNQGMEVRGGTQLVFEWEAASTIQGDMNFVPLPGQNLPYVVGRAPTGNWRAVFRNTTTGESAGVLSVSNGGLLEADLAGTGLVMDSDRLGGNISPSDESGSNSLGVINIQQSNVTLLPTSAVEIDVLDTKRYDRVVFFDNVIVDGTLKVRAPAGFYPPPAFDFLVIRGKCTGAFSRVEAPPGFRAEMRYNFMGASVRLVKRCGSDFDQSGAVDESDFEVFAAAYSLMDCADPLMQEQCPADLDRDRFVDDADFSMFAVAFDRAICD